MGVKLFGNGWKGFEIETPSRFENIGTLWNFHVTLVFRNSFHIVTLTGAKEDSKRPRTRPRSLSGATGQPGLPPKASRPSRGRHRTAIATAAALGLEEAAPTAAPPGSSDRVRSYTRHRAAIAETRGLWDETEPIGRGSAPEESPSLRRVNSVHSVPSPDKEKSSTGRPKRHQRSLERSIDKSWFA